MAVHGRRRAYEYEQAEPDVPRAQGSRGARRFSQDPAVPRRARSAVLPPPDDWRECVARNKKKTEQPAVTGKVAGPGRHAAGRWMGLDPSSAPHVASISDSRIPAPKTPARWVRCHLPMRSDSASASGVSAQLLQAERTTPRRLCGGAYPSESDHRKWRKKRLKMPKLFAAF